MRRVSLVVAFVGLNLMACCCGGCGSREETSKKIEAAHAMWDGGKKADAVVEYKAIFGDSRLARFALPEEKERMLPRIVEFETKAGNIGKAKIWVKRGLDDKINAEYTDPAAKELFAAVKKEHDNRLAQEKAAEEKAAQVKRDAERGREEQELKELHEKEARIWDSKQENDPLSRALKQDVEKAEKEIYDKLSPDEKGIVNRLKSLTPQEVKKRVKYPESTAFRVTDVSVDKLLGGKWAVGGIAHYQSDDGPTARGEFTIWFDGNLELVSFDWIVRPTDKQTGRGGKK